MGSFAIGALAALIGVLSGQGLAVAIRGKKSDERLTALESAVPELITRAEVSDAFAQMAQIEAARIAQEQKAARSGAVFGTGMSPQAQGAVERTGEMNKQINAQLAQLTRRMQEMNSQLGIEG